LLGPGVATSTDTAPDWIYVSRDGSNPQAMTGDLTRRETAAGPNPKFVVGRYAYRLYDTSGLLDINAAGHPPELPGPERVGHKGTLAMADLTAIPGMTRQGVEELARWRHHWTAAADITDEDEYIRRSEGSGWQRLAHNDNLFLSRQDLLRFARLHPPCLPDAALPFLTHFSRDLDAPSWMPHPKRPKVKAASDRGGNDAYGTDDEVNPDLMAFNKERQSFLLQRRFPLDRLQWVATPGKDGPADPAKAERYFGLRWAGSHWTYIHARPNGDLYSLQDVPPGREPNFFEILRAAVLCGSLGRQYGATGFAAGPELQQWSHKIGGIDGSINLNIMEMGACLIDQADRDSYPTAISLRGAMRDFWVFGKEDVPYLYRTIAVPYRSKRLPARVPGADRILRGGDGFAGRLVAAAPTSQGHICGAGEIPHPAPACGFVQRHGVLPARGLARARETRRSAVSTRRARRRLHLLGWPQLPRDQSRVVPQNFRRLRVHRSQPAHCFHRFP
jgi:hypothetical protein